MIYQVPLFASASLRHFSYIILCVGKMTYALARNGTRRELVARQYDYQHVVSGAFYHRRNVVICIFKQIYY